VTRKFSTFNFSIGSVSTKFILLTVVSILMIYLDQQGEAARGLREKASLSLYPIYSTLMFFVDGIQHIDDYFYDRTRMIEEIETLNQQALIDSVRLQTLEYTREQNSRLSELLNLTLFPDDDYTAARIVDASLNPYEHRVMIDAGATSGVQESAMVVTQGGVLGQIMRVQPLNSLVILLTDPDHALPLISLRTSYRTIAFGMGNNVELVLPFITPETDIRIGDEFVTSGLGGVFHPGYFVGRISSFSDRSEGSFAEVRLEIGYKMNEVNEVLIIQN